MKQDARLCAAPGSRAVFCCRRFSLFLPGSRLYNNLSRASEAKAEKPRHVGQFSGNRSINAVYTVHGQAGGQRRRYLDRSLRTPHRQRKSEQENAEALGTRKIERLPEESNDQSTRTHIVSDETKNVHCSTGSSTVDHLPAVILDAGQGQSGRSQRVRSVQKKGRESLRLTDVKSLWKTFFNAKVWRVAESARNLLRVALF